MDYKIPPTPGRLSLLLAAVIVGASALILSHTWILYREASRSAIHAQQVIVKTRQLMSAVKDAETAQGGFLLSRDNHYLDPYLAAQTALPGLLADLTALSAGPADLQQAVARMHLLTQQKMNELQETIAMAKAGRHAEAVVRLRAGHGKEIMDELRDLETRLEATESARAARQSQLAERRGYFAFIFSIGGLTFVFLALLYSTLAAGRARKRELKLIEQERAGQQALVESESRFRSVADSAPVLIWIAGTDKRFLYVNKGWLAFTGRVLEQELGNGWTEGIYADDLKETLENFAKAFDAREPFRLEFRRRRHDGEFRWMINSGVPLTRPNGDFTGYIGSCVDIHDRKMVEEELERRVKERTEQLHYKEQELIQSRKIEAIGRLAGGVAHDFNNLLTGIAGMVEEVHNDLTSPEHRENLEQVLKATERAAGLTRQLLAFGRRQIVTPVVLDVNQAIGEMLGMLRRMIGEDVQLHTIFSSAPALVRMDHGQLEQIVINLMINARDAMPQGGKITLETALMNVDENYTKKHFQLSVGPHVLLAISDTGTGMDEQTQEHIFEPFFTTKEVGRGSGMGLASVYGIVKQNNGDIFLYSTPGAGTSFKIYLPQTSDALSPAPAAQAPRILGDETVLLVEDEELVRRTASRALIRRGYKVLEARHGKEALEISSNYNDKIDLLLTDVVMPGLNGRQLAELLAHQRPEMRVLYMSGYTENIIVQRGMLKPGISFIEKSFTADTLCAKVRSVLDAKVTA